MRLVASPRSHPRLRLNVLRVIVFAALAVLLFRLWSLQVFEHGRYQVTAEGNRVREVVSQAPRGVIVDDQGKVFATNKTSLVITIDRSVLDRQADSGRSVIARLATVLHTTPAALNLKTRICTRTVGKPCWNGSPYQPIPVATNVAPQVALSVIEHPERFPGVSADTSAVRVYPQGSLAAHEIGYTGPASQAQLADVNAGYTASDVVGQAGIESSYDNYLRGTAGVKKLAVDRYGRVSGTMSATPAKAGDTVVLALDSGVQSLLEQSLANELTLAQQQGKPATAGSGVVLDWHTGQVIAMASLPTYNPSVFTGGISQQDYAALTSPASGDPLISRAFQSTGAPGSTFKAVSLSAAVASGADLNGSYACPSGVNIGGQFFHNFEGEAAGDISLHEAIVISCDVIFDQFAYNAWLADGGLRTGSGPYAPPKEYFTNMAKAYGFGRDSGIDLPGESSGWVVDRAGELKIWKQMKATYCARAKTGYPDDPNPADAQLLKEYAQEGCTDGYLYNGGAATMFGIGQGQYLSVEPAAVGRRLRGGRQRRHRLSPAGREGDRLPGRFARAEDRPLGRRPPAGEPDRPAVHPRLDDRRDPARHGLRRVRRLPARPDPHRRQDRNGGGPGPQRHLLVRLVQRPVRHRGLDSRHRPGRELRGTGGAQGLRGPLRGGPSRAAAGPAERVAEADAGDCAVTNLLPGTRPPRRLNRGPVTLEPLSGPGAATSRARERHDISWRRVDWVLAFAVLALCVIGSLLIASATRQYQLDHHLDQYAYLKKHLLTVGIGVALAILVARSDFRLVRAYTPIVYLAFAGRARRRHRHRFDHQRRPFVDRAARGFSAAALRARQARSRRRARADPRAAARRGSHRRPGNPGRPGTAAGAGVGRRAAGARHDAARLRYDHGADRDGRRRARGLAAPRRAGWGCSSRQEWVSVPRS